MRLVLNIFLFTIFFLSTTGVSIARHFCHGHLVSTEIAISTKDDSCCSKKNGVKPNCCDNEVETFKIDQEFLQSEKDQIDIELFVIDPIIAIDVASQNVQQYQIAYDDYRPPPISGRTLIIHKSSFLL